MGTGEPHRRLLIVDDEPDIRTLLSMSLERLGGFEVVSVGDGQAALDLLTSGTTVDAVLLDVQMPGLDGPSTLTKLRELPGCEQLPAAFLTASVQVSQRRALEDLPVNALIEKPFDPVTLPDTVRSVFGW
ncbi:MAG: response regulator [Actinomycetes bacterium]